MKIGLVLGAFGGPGGTEKYTADLAAWLVQKGHEVDVWCARCGRDVPGVRVRPLAVRGRGWVRERSLLAASRAVPADSYDVVQGFGRTLGHQVFRAGGGVHAAWLRASAPHGIRRAIAALSPRQAWTVRVDREAAASARVVVCNSRRVASEMLAFYELTESVIRVVRNGVDGQRFRVDASAREAARVHWRVPDQGRVVLFLGTGFRRKGLDVAARAFELACGEHDRFVVIGRDARSGSRLRKVASTLGERFVAHGPVADPERWIPGADATILPTLYDAAANSTLEAMSCGVPPVTSSMDGSSEVVPDPDLVVEDPLDATAFGRALEHALGAGPGLATACREAAADWTVERNGKTMETLYLELMNG